MVCVGFLFLSVTVGVPLLEGGFGIISGFFAVLGFYRLLAYLGLALLLFLALASVKANNPQ